MSCAGQWQAKGALYRLPKENGSSKNTSEPMKLFQVAGMIGQNPIVRIAERKRRHHLFASTDPQAALRAE
jgi:hypothetical protein